jgi:hypothetical protein
MKRKHSMTYICIATVAEKSQDICAVYLNMANIASGSSIRRIYEVIVPLITFNISTSIQYLHNFFGVWTLEIVPILDNMVFKIISCNGRVMNTGPHANRRATF